jgi:DNA-directed RNA polymerase specialized sigma24 family protein
MYTPNATTESDLAARAKQGDKIAAARLIAPHYASVNRYFRAVFEDPMAADEVTREALEETLRSLSAFEPARESFRVWLFRQIGRGAARRRDAGGLLGGLPDAEREVVTLRCAADLRWGEITAVTGRPGDAARALCEHALELLIGPEGPQTEVA